MVLLIACILAAAYTHIQPLRHSLSDVMIAVGLMVMGTLHYGMYGHEHIPYLWPFADPDQHRPKKIRALAAFAAQSRR
jgi:hypothetical protein